MMFLNRRTESVDIRQVSEGFWKGTELLVGQVQICTF